MPDSVIVVSSLPRQETWFRRPSSLPAMRFGAYELLVWASCHSSLDVGIHPSIHPSIYPAIHVSIRLSSLQGPLMDIEEK